MMTEKCSKNVPKFFCEFCDYKCSKQSVYNKHISTRKHKMMTNDDKKMSHSNKCDCGKILSSRQALYRHKKICNKNNENNVKDEMNEENNIEELNTVEPQVILELLKQNREFKELLLEQQQENQKLQTKIIETENKLLDAVKEGKTIHYNTTTNNNKFNLNFFLNEQCKDAMNISDFINNMILSVEDLKNTGKLGYIGGITKIFTDKLRQLDTYARPMHCTDLKRETLYIKNNDKWTKDTDDKYKIKTAIECVANKNLNNLDAWKEENPNHVVMDSSEDKEFVEIMTNSLGGMGSDREKNKQKIIKNVLKEIIVDK